MVSDVWIQYQGSVHSRRAGVVVPSNWPGFAAGVGPTGGNSSYILHLSIERCSPFILFLPIANFIFPFHPMFVFLQVDCMPLVTRLTSLVTPRWKAAAWWSWTRCYKAVHSYHIRCSSDWQRKLELVSRKPLSFDSIWTDTISGTQTHKTFGCTNLVSLMF